jgi:hypothetical protein
MRGHRQSVDASGHPRWKHWLNRHSWIAGAAALLWLIYRSGTKPSRFAYPCQQAAFSTAALVFGVPVVATIVALRARLFTPRGLVVALAGLATTFGIWAYLSQTPAYNGPDAEPRQTYRASVYNAYNPTGPVGDHFAQLDDLIEIMGAGGLKFYRSDVTSLTAGPEGLFAADDVIIIKINYQWSQRGGTNTDLLRGLIRRLVDHPDTFTGEIVVGENGQFAGLANFDRDQNNAETQSQSPHDVIVPFETEGFRVSHFDWTLVRYLNVSEFSDGNMTDGYVVYPYSSDFYGRISYPKFTTTYGTRISTRDGIWLGGQDYDRDRLKFINVPVLKSHHSTYGATACVKNYMGLVSTQTGLSTQSHTAMRYGLLGALLAEIQPATLNILDATWINADPTTGPSTGYEGATRKDMLVASVDPVAADMWAVTNILIPAFNDNGYYAPYPEPSADPGNPTSDFREYLDNSMAFLLDAGYDATNDLASIDGINLAPPGEASDPGGAGDPLTIAKDGGGYTLAWSDPVRGGSADEFVLYGIDLAGGPPECETTLGAGLSAFVASLPDNHAFVVVGRNGAGDGSFGSDSRGIERASAIDTGVCP